MEMKQCFANVNFFMNTTHIYPVLFRWIIVLACEMKGFLVCLWKVKMKCTWHFKNGKKISLICQNIFLTVQFTFDIMTLSAETLWFFFDCTVYLWHYDFMTSDPMTYVDGLMLIYAKELHDCTIKIIYMLKWSDGNYHLTLMSPFQP